MSGHARNYAEHPTLTQHLGVLMEELHLADVADHDAAHVPFSVAFDGANLGFPVADKYVWAAILISIIYSAIQLKLI